MSSPNRAPKEAASTPVICLDSAPTKMPDSAPVQPSASRKNILNVTKNSTVQEGRCEEKSSLTASLPEIESSNDVRTSPSPSTTSTTKEESTMQSKRSSIGSIGHKVQVKLPPTVKVSNTSRAAYDSSLASSKGKLESVQSLAAPNNAHQGPCTPESKRIHRDVPSSIDSSYDDMTLADLRSLVNGQSAKMPAAKRSLSLALDVASFDAENVDPQRQGTGSSVNVSSTSFGRSVPLVPIPSSESVGTVEEANTITLPDISSIVNFPQFREHGVNPAGTKSCLLCGNVRMCIAKRSEKEGETPYILLSNKSICSVCEAIPWTLVDGNIHIKFCQQCTRFKPLAFFSSTKSTNFVSSCIPCREHKKVYAKIRKEAKARRNEAGTVAGADSDKAGTAPALGKRQVCEASDGVSLGTDTDLSKRPKVEWSETDKVKQDAEAITVATETDSSISDGSRDREGFNAANCSSVNEEVARPDGVVVSSGVEVAEGGETPIHMSPDVSSIGRNRCVPLSTLPPSFSSPKGSKRIIVPAFATLTNFPQRSPEKRGPNKQCVMCGQRRFVKKRKDAATGLVFIPFGNKGVCTECESIPWEIVKTNAAIKWCKQGCHFRPLDSFVDLTSKGEKPVLQASCLSCLDLATAYK